jgi:hypothetical protein
MQAIKKPARENLSESNSAYYAQLEERNPSAGSVN